VSTQLVQKSFKICIAQSAKMLKLSKDESEELKEQHRQHNEITKTA
jgi:hypothetical protein